MQTNFKQSFNSPPSKSNYSLSWGLRWMLSCCLLFTFALAGSAQDCCDIGDKPCAVTFRYNGESCSQTNTNQQSGKFECDNRSGGPNGDTQVYIIASSDSGGSGTRYFQGNVNINSTFTMSTGSCGNGSGSGSGSGNKFNSRTNITIYASQGGTRLQDVEFHTSCSAPIVIGDQIGSLVLTDVQFNNGASCTPQECPTPTITVTPNDPTGGNRFCTNAPIRFEAPDVDFPCFTYSWSFGAGASPQTATGRGPHFVTYTTIGNRSALLTIDNNCTPSDDWR